ncbi:MAG: YihY/virulence factor BrkB family protein [Aggregatilineales bacterium]
MLNEIFQTLKQTVQEFMKDGAAREAAALAYYIAFAMAPLLVVVIGVVGAIYGPEAVQGEIVQEIQGTVGEDAAVVVQDVIKNAYNAEGSTLSTIFSAFMLLMSASAVFLKLQTTLNNIWNVEPATGGGIGGIIRGRLLSLGMLLIIGMLLLVSLVLSAVLAALDNLFVSILPATEAFISIIGFGINFGVTTLLFAMLYKFLPDAEIRWREVIIGAAMTALLFAVGRTVLGIYLANSSTSSTYGAAGSFVVILLWIYYASQIILLGAEFTQVYARRYGQRIQSAATVEEEVSVPV